MQCRSALQRALDRIRQAVRRDHAKPLTALWHHVYDVKRLREAYYGLKRLEKYKRHFHVPPTAPSAGGYAPSRLFPAAQCAVAARRRNRSKAQHSAAQLCLGWTCVSGWGRVASLWA